MSPPPPTCLDWIRQALYISEHRRYPLEIPSDQRCIDHLGDRSGQPDRRIGERL